MTAPLYSLLIVVHVLSAVIGFAALGATGAFAAALRRAPDPLSLSAPRRYFAPGHNWAARVLYLVPIFGLALVFGSHDHLAQRAYPWIGLGVWVIATGIATAIVFPAETQLQALFCADAPDRARVSLLARRLEFGAAATSLCFVVSLVVMIGQP